MKAKTLIAGVVGGVVLFAWGAVSHMVLGLGETGIKVMPSEDAVLTAMRDNLHEPGVYFFPGEGMMTGQPTAEQQKRWEEKYRQGPTGILIYQPQGWEPFDPMQFITELVADIGAALIAAFLLAAAGGLTGMAWRVLFVGAMSLIASADIHVSYWNWYRFPTDYTLGTVADGFIGWLLVGVVLALMIKPRAS